MKSKIIIIVFSAVVLGLTACSGKSSKNQDAHTHENCTNHAHDHAAPKQESFIVEGDSIIVDTDSHKNCPEGHDHQH